MRKPSLLEITTATAILVAGAAIWIAGNEAIASGVLCFFPLGTYLATRITFRRRARRAPSNVPHHNGTDGP